MAPPAQTDEIKRRGGGRDLAAETERGTETGGGRGPGLGTGNGAGPGTGKRGRETRGTGTGTPGTPGTGRGTPRRETRTLTPGETVRILMESPVAPG